MQEQKYDNERFAAGASASLQKSIKDIEAIISGSKTSFGAPLRNRFRRKLYNALRDASMRWYRIGFRRGHNTCYKMFRKTGRIGRRVSKRTRATFIRGDQSKKVLLKTSI